MNIIKTHKVSNKISLTHAKHTTLWLFFILVLSFALSAQDGFVPGSLSVSHAEFRDSVYNQSDDSAKIFSLFNANLETVSNFAPELKRLYWSARLHFLMGWHYLRTIEDKKLARQQWELMLEYTERALDIEEFSDGYRLRSEAISHLCMVTSVTWVLINGLKIMGACEKALELNSENAKAMFVLGASKTYPPFWFGGNPKEAVRLLLKAQKMDFIEKNDFYNIYTALGVAYLKQKKYERAVRWLKKSLSIYPNNAFSQSTLEKAANKSEVDLQKYYPPEKEE